MKNKKKLLLIIIPVLVAALLIGAYFLSGIGKTSKGSKNVEISVIDNVGAQTDYKVKTDAEYLRGAMEDTKGLTFSGEDQGYGMYVKVVNGVTADYDVDQSFWCFYLNEESCMLGIDSQPIADGDKVKIVYTK